MNGKRCRLTEVPQGVLAAFAQFDNDVRSDCTRAGMRAALQLGRWTFLAPIGYLNAPRSTGKSLMADPERAPLVRRAFEEYATGRVTKGRNEYYAYYHCCPGCRAVNVTKSKLEGLFTDELALLQPTPAICGY